MSTYLMFNLITHLLNGVHKPYKHLIFNKKLPSTCLFVGLICGAAMD